MKTMHRAWLRLLARIWPPMPPMTPEQKLDLMLNSHPKCC